MLADLRNRWRLLQHDRNPEFIGEVGEKDFARIKMSQVIRETEAFIQFLRKGVDDRTSNDLKNIRRHKGTIMD